MSTDAAKEREREIWLKDVRDAYDRFTIELEATNGPVWYVEAGVGNGSRISVVCSVIPPEARVLLGADTLVTVIWPWQACYGLQGFNGRDLRIEDVRAKLVPRSEKNVNGGDVAGVTLAVAHALSRPAYLGIEDS